MSKIMRSLFIVLIILLIKISLFSGEIYKDGFVYETYVDSGNRERIFTRSYLRYIWNYYGGGEPEISKGGYFPENLEQLEAYIAEKEEDTIRIVYFPENSIFFKYAIDKSSFMDPFTIVEIGRKHGYRCKIRTRVAFFGHFDDKEDQVKFLKEYFTTDFAEGLPLDPLIRVKVILLEKKEY